MPIEGQLLNVDLSKPVRSYRYVCCSLLRGTSHTKASACLPFLPLSFEPITESRHSYPFRYGLPGLGLLRAIHKQEEFTNRFAAEI